MENNSDICYVTITDSQQTPWSNNQQESLNNSQHLNNSVQYIDINSRDMSNGDNILCYKCKQVLNTKQESDISTCYLCQYDPERKCICCKAQTPVKGYGICYICIDGVLSFT